MAIGTPSLLTTINHWGSDVNDRTTSSFTPTAGTLLKCDLTTQNQAGNLNDANGHMSVSQTHSGSWSWTILGNGSNATFDPNGSTYYGRVFTAYAIVPASPGSGTITFTFNGGGGAVNRARNIVIAQLSEIPGVDPTSPITQSIIARAGSSASNTATFGSSLASSSMAFAHVGNSYQTTGTTITQPTGYTKAVQLASADGFFNQQLAVAYQNGSAGTSVNWTTLSSLFGSSTIAVELKEAPAPPSSRRIFVVS